MAGKPPSDLEVYLPSCQYCVPLDYGRSEQLSCSPRLSKWNPTSLSRLHPTFQEPDIQINDAVRDSWKHDQLENVVALLTAAVPESQDPNHHVLTSRPLAGPSSFATVGRGPVALFSHALTLVSMYTKSINIQPSVIGYIAECNACCLKALILLIKLERDPFLPRPTAAQPRQRWIGIVGTRVAAPSALRSHAISALIALARGSSNDDGPYACI